MKQYRVRYLTQQDTLMTSRNGPFDLRVNADTERNALFDRELDANIVWVERRLTHRWMIIGKVLVRRIDRSFVL